ncbi:NUDIX domain-containing protein [Candidatus Kaiserbacteria bacterium]|nr:NUDIX domain-containing protein [Candidatus Kaiserbacteria bacterium]
MSSGKTVVCRNRLTGETKEVPAEKLRFRPAAYGVIIKEGSVLLNTAWDGHDFPGGGIDLGESIRDALLREIKEETGISVQVGPLLHVGEDFFIANFVEDTYFHALPYYFLCTDAQGQLSMEGFAAYEKEYMKGPEWVPLEKVDSLKFYNSIDSATLIRKAAEGGGHTVTI